MTRVFLCFSSKDRFTVVDSVLYHLKRYGVSVWYDYHELTLGDNRIEGNFINGLNNCNYAVIIISPNMYDCICGNDELNEIHRRHLEKSIHIFPLFYNVTASELPSQYRWLTTLIYNEIDDASGTLLPCRQIVYKLICDMAHNTSKRNLMDYNNTGNQFINKMLSAYQLIDDSNHNAKFSILYALFLYLDTSGVFEDKLCRDVVERISQETDFNINYPHKELLIMERIVTIMLDSAISDNHCIS